MSEQLECNKKTVTAFYDLMFNQYQPAEAIVLFYSCSCEPSEGK